MHKTTITLTAQSADEFREKLRALAQPGRKSQSLVLLLQDPRVYVNVFQVKHGPQQDIRYHILMEAVEKLSLPAEDIVLDYRILSRDPDMVFGVYVCASRETIAEYVSLADPRTIRLVKITDRFLCLLDRFLKTEACQNRCYCLLYMDRAQEFRVAVLQDARITLIRHVQFEDINEASDALIQTLRFVCAKSKIKSLDGIFMGGDGTSRHYLMEVLKKNVEVDSPVEELREEVFWGAPNVNLLRERLQWQKTQKALYAAWTAGLMIVFILTGALTWKIYQLEMEIGWLSSVYSVYDYELARKYKERLFAHE
ncbi:MAG: hypothetical protein WC450_01710 [Candidatus Omnitrophota bacterium]|jgi:hypothetical protein